MTKVKNIEEEREPELVTWLLLVAENAMLKKSNVKKDRHIATLEKDFDKMRAVKNTWQHAAEKAQAEVAAKWKCWI